MVEFFLFLNGTIANFFELDISLIVTFLNKTRR